MAKRKKIEKAAPEPQQVTDGGTVEAKPVKYVVLRAGYRVSDKEYSDSNDPACVSELEFWTKVERFNSHGAPVETVVFDPKKHRVW